MMIIYNILFVIAFVLYFPILLVRGKIHGGFIQRLGFLSPEVCYLLSQKANIWVHAVSVGEVLAVLGLLERIRSENPEKRIVLSAVTPTGFQLARTRLRKEDVVIYAPLDFGLSVTRYLKVIQPDIFITVETELWPNLLTALARRDVPMVMVNGRISGKSFYRYQRLRFFFRGVLRPFRAFCMQTSQDADRIIAMGAPPKNVMVAGSMKFDDVGATQPMDRARLGLREDDLLWVAGSTHPGEEKVIVELFAKLRKKFPKLCLLLAPRHIERAAHVCEVVAQAGFPSRRFSRLMSDPAVENPVIVVDTIGHLKSMYQLASVVFVGKSLFSAGGQNIIEPAFFEKPIVIGPHMENFQEIADAFLESKSIIQVQGPTELEPALERLLADPVFRQTLGRRAAATVRKHQGATALTAQLISRVINTTRFISIK